jgi:hypothetical protein
MSDNTLIVLLCSIVRLLYLKNRIAQRLALFGNNAIDLAPHGYRLSYFIYKSYAAFVFICCLVL